MIPTNGFQDNRGAEQQPGGHLAIVAGLISEFHELQPLQIANITREATVPGFNPVFNGAQCAPYGRVRTAHH
jgi:hypothetical protein